MNSFKVDVAEACPSCILCIHQGAAAGCVQGTDLTQLDYRNAEAGERGDS